MSQEKRLPQVGEIWWNRNGSLRGPLTHSTNTHYPLRDEKEEENYTLDGVWLSPGGGLSLVLIHSDASGKIINPKFNGGVPMHPQPKTKPAKADPVAQAITEAQERVQGLTQLAHDMADLATRKGDVKRLAAKVKEGRAKWMPEAKKAGKKVK